MNTLPTDIICYLLFEHSVKKSCIILNKNLYNRLCRVIQIYRKSVRINFLEQSFKIKFIDEIINNRMYECTIKSNIFYIKFLKKFKLTGIDYILGKYCYALHTGTTIVYNLIIPIKNGLCKYYLLNRKFGYTGYHITRHNLCDKDISYKDFIVQLITQIDPYGFNSIPAQDISDYFEYNDTLTNDKIFNKYQDILEFIK